MNLVDLGRRVLQRIRILTGTAYDHLRIGVNCPTAWYGDSYGGSFACPVLLSADSIVYSVGIGEDITFDLDLITRHGCTVYGFDPTPKSIAWIGAQQVPERFRFFGYGLGARTGTVDFFLPKVKAHVSGSATAHSNVDSHGRVPVLLKSLADIATELGHRRVDLLKIDVEGSEYEMLGSILGSGVEIGQLLIEFHERFFDDGKQRTIAALAQLRAHGFELFAVSDLYRQCSFIRTDLVPQL